MIRIQALLSVLSVLLLSSFAALPPVDATCAGCASQTPDGTEDLSAGWDVYETALPSSVLQCRVQVRITVGTYFETCKQRSGDCSEAICGQTYSIEIRSATNPSGSHGCAGILINLDSGGQAITPDKDAGDYDADPTAAWGSWAQAHLDSFGGACGAEHKKSIDVTMTPVDWGGTGAGADTSMTMYLKCADCNSTIGGE